MKQKRLIKSLRSFRVWHRLVGVSLSILVLISATTGIFLAFKKNVAALQPPTQKGSSSALENWKPMSELAVIAQKALADSTTQNIVIDRMDARPSKGIVKVLFEEGWWEVQLDASSGVVLSIAKRHADWIEQLHDGSTISGAFKLASMNLLGFGLILMVITGLWLWYGIKVYRKLKQRSN